MYLIEDILFNMMSVDGVYIKRRPDQFNKTGYQYVIDPSVECHLSLKQIVNKILPICNFHDQIE